MEQDDRLLNAMFEMCNHKNPLNDGQREWHIADIPACCAKNAMTNWTNATTRR